MKYVKENLVLVIVGAVVLLLLVAAFAYPLPGFRADLQQQMQDQANNAKTIKDLSSKSLELPGAQTQKGVANQAWVDKKKETIKAIDDSRVAVEGEARTANAKGRIDDKGNPLLPVPSSVDLSKVGIPLIDPGTKKPILPHSNDPMEFKANYQRLFRIWTNILATGKLDDSGPAPATPPHLEDLTQAFTAQLAAEAAKQPIGPNGQTMGNQGGSVALTNRRFYDYAKGAVMNRAAGIQMYVEPSPNGFQIRDWAFRDQAPSDQQIFEGLVDTWIQADIVKAIVQVNNPRLGAGLDRNVGKAAIKRLTRITIGNAARTRILGGTTPGTNVMTTGTPTANAQVTDPGPLFFTASNASSTGGAGGGGPVMGPAVGGGAVQPDPNALATPNSISYDLSMTGRSGGADYDVVHVSILVDIDPAYLNAFEKALYMQNMGYAVEGEQTRTVDPLERASYGYLYGDGQVVEAEIQVEALFFRPWTTPLMPPTVRQILGIPAPATPATGQ